MQWKLITQKKYIEEQQQTTKTSFGLWLMLPFLIYMTFIYGEYEIMDGLFNESREPRISLGTLQLLVIFFEIGLYIIYVGYLSMIKFYRFFFLALGVLSIFCGASSLIGRRALVMLNEKTPFSPDEVLEFESWEDFLNENAVDMFGLGVNILAVVVFCVCGWAKKEDTDIRVKKDLFLNFNRYSRWVFRCVLVSVGFSLVTIFSTILIQLFHSSIPDLFTDSLFGIVLILLGSSAIGHYKNNKCDDTDDESSGSTCNA